MSEAVNAVAVSRPNRNAVAISGQVQAGNLAAQTDVWNEEDKLEAANLGHMANARVRATAKYAQGLEAIKGLLREVDGQELSDGERVMLQVSISQQKDVMVTALMSVASSGVDHKETVNNDVKKYVATAGVNDSLLP